MRNSFVFYRSFQEAIKHLPAGEQLAVYTAITDYSLDGILPNLKGAAAAVFVLIKPLIDSNNKKYENGKKGGRGNQTETKPEPNDNQTETKPEPNSNPMYYVDVDVKDNTPLTPQGETPDGAGRERFTPPTVDEVAAYCQERSNGIGAEQFVDFYAAKGWFIGKNKMKDWKAAVRTWEKNHKNSADTRGQSYPEDGTPHPDGGKWYRGQQLLGV